MPSDPNYLPIEFSNSEFALLVSEGDLLMRERKETRSKTLKGGRIVFLNGSATRDCAIRNVSASGARLVMESVQGLPDEFKLEFEDGTRKACFVRWRKFMEMGVEFKDE